MFFVGSKPDIGLRAEQLEASTAADPANMYGPDAIRSRP